MNPPFPSFVSFTPGVELVLEAFDQYWRKTPNVKRLVLRVIPYPAPRLAALKRGQVDIAYLISAELGEELRRTPGLTMKPTYPSTHFLVFADQSDPKSPWHDRRVRLAANLAMDRQGLNQAATFGLSRITGSIVLSTLEFHWRSPTYPHDPARARQLVTEAGYPNGLDAGDYFCDLQVTSWAEALLADLKGVGIRLRLRPLERAAFFKSLSEKTLKNIIHVFSGDFGNAASRLEAFAVSVAPTRTEAIRTSTASSVSRPLSSTERSGKRSSTGCSSSSTSGRCSRRSGSSRFSTASVPAWRNQASGSSLGTDFPRLTKT